MACPPACGSAGSARGLRIAVASGKGGTGKTLFATHLAWHLSARGRATTYVDADVEEPNGHLLLDPQLGADVPVTVPQPVMTRFRCSRCGLCVEACAFNAVMVGGGGALFFPELCHGCGNCIRVCPDGVLEERHREVGRISSGRTGALDFLSGTLNVGEPRAVPLTDALLQRACSASGEVIIDCPPGTSCAAMAAVRHADLALLVTEPTPFGWHDLELAMQMCFALGLPVAVAINRADLGGAPVRQWLEGRGVPVVAEMPFSRDLAEANARGRMITAEGHSFCQVVQHLTDVLFGAELWDAAREALSVARSASDTDWHRRSGTEPLGGSA